MTKTTDKKKFIVTATHSGGSVSTPYEGTSINDNGDGLLSVYDGADRIAAYAPGCWLSWRIEPK